MFLTRFKHEAKKMKACFGLLQTCGLTEGREGDASTAVHEDMYTKLRKVLRGHVEVAGTQNVGGLKNLSDVAILLAAT